MEPEGSPVELREIGNLQEDSRPTRLVVVDYVRAALAGVFAFFLLIVILWGFHNTGGEWTATKELLQLLLPALTGLLGSAVGFYFGAQKVQ